MKKLNTSALQAQCDEFNAACPEGGKVQFQRSTDASWEDATTLSEAWVLLGHTPVVMLKGNPGCYCLTHVRIVAAA